MNKGAVILFVLVLFIPVAYSISIKELIARYIFSAATAQMNVTSYKDFMIDRNNNWVNDTLVIELTTNNANGNFNFVVNLFDKNGVLTNETNKTLNAGTNKINITFNSIFLTQSQFNYSIKIYNSTYSLKYRKDSISTQNYGNYERGFEIVNIEDSQPGKSLKINITLNSTINETFETVLFLSYNGSIISVKENKSIISSKQNLIFNFDNETIKRTHYIGNFNVSSLKIGKKTIKTDFTTSHHNFKDFAATSYIFDFTDIGVDTNNNNKYNFLRINASAQIFNDGYYTILMAIYDLFDNIIEVKNESASLSLGKNIVVLDFNGSRIYDKKLNGPYIVKYVQLFQDGVLTDYINNAHTTKNYNFNDFDSQSMPDLGIKISASDLHKYGIGNITINFTFKNTGNMHAFNVFTEIFDNNTFSKMNKSNILHANSQILYQINFTNISDFEISAIADLQNIVEELNESNNAEKLIIKLNRHPKLELISNITINETGKITISLSASDPNEDRLSYSINFSKFSNNSNVFQWQTTTTDSGNYTLMAVASDGYLNDSALFHIVVIDAPEKDSDNDGINDSVDNIIGDENSINTSTINLTVFLGDSSNLSRLLNESAKIRFMDKNFTVAEFDFDFSAFKLNLTNIAVDKQSANATGSLLIKGLKMPEGATKALYVDRADAALNGLCIKDSEISSLDEISESCDLSNEFKVECDGTLQGSYSCTYNSTSNKYKVQGLKHSGIVQIEYAKPAPSPGSTSSAGSSGSSGGGGGVICISSWQCDEWSECINGFRSRKCVDKNQCAFPTKKPSEKEQCIAEEEIGTAKGKKASAILPAGFEDKTINTKALLGITGQAVLPIKQKVNFDFLLGLALIISLLYFSIKAGVFSKIFK